MSKILTHCRFCSKQVEVTNEQTIEAFGQILKTYSCGHTVCEEIVAQRRADEGQKLVCKICSCEVPDIRIHMSTSHMNTDTSNYEWIEQNIVSIPSHRHPSYARLMNFQQSGADFIEKSNFNCAILDEMGLGKTAQALVALRHNKEKLTPALFVVKGGLRLNWANEMVNKQWLTDGWSVPDVTELPFILLDGKSAVMPGMKYYIIGMNLLTKYEESLKNFGFRLLVVDESQNFSNITSKRTKALMNIARTIPHRICLSGTPILNRASEFFTTLNLIKNDHWTNYAAFVRNWIEMVPYQNSAGNTSYKLGGIKPWRRESFHTRISPYVLRRMKRDVLKDLPRFSRRFKILQNEDSAVATAYNKTAKELEDYLYSYDYQHDSGFDRSNKMLAYLVKMRHLCGIAKVPLILEEVREFLESSENNGESEKLIIGCHHDEVLRQLQIGLKDYEPVILSSGLDNIEREARITEFKNGSRLCIAKILAQGEGLNLQFCHRMFITERMWNPGKEEQFEARIDRYGQTEPTFADYFVMKNTVDETFTEIVEEKRRICGETLSDQFDFEMDPSLLGFLAQNAARTRM